jgi:hypothetical protein
MRQRIQRGLTGAAAAPMGAVARAAAPKPDAVRRAGRRHAGRLAVRAGLRQPEQEPQRPQQQAPARFSLPRAVALAAAALALGALAAPPPAAASAASAAAGLVAPAEWCTRQLVLGVAAPVVTSLIGIWALQKIASRLEQARPGGRAKDKVF